MVKSVTKVVTVTLGATVLLIDAPHPASGNVPFTTWISGYLNDAYGEGIPDRVVKVYFNDVEVASLITNNNPQYGWVGQWFTTDIWIRDKGTIRVYAKFAGDAAYAASTSATVTITATKKTTAMVMDNPQPASGQVPFTTKIGGQLTDSGGGGIGGKTVDIYVNAVKFASVATNSNPLAGWIGIWWVNVLISAVGTYNIYAEFVGDAEWEGCEESNA